jgi:hypothetical protein
MPHRKRSRTRVTRKRRRNREEVHSPGAHIKRRAEAGPTSVAPASAVLGTTAGLHRHDALDLDLIAAAAGANVVRQREQAGELIFGQHHSCR